MNPMDIDEARETQFQPAASVPAAAVPNDRRFQALGDLHSLPDETLCAILTYLSPHDIGRLSCVSSVMYIFCNEEPLWMALCLKNMDRRLEYKGSWKRTTLHQLDLLTEYEKSPAKQLHFNGFYSLFLYRRLYRCYTTLDGFSFDNGNVDRKKDLSLQEFSNNYDGQKPVLISGLADTWPARNSWTVEQLLQNYGDLAFHLSQRSSRKIIMTFKDYVSYMQIQHDEDPLYVFDDKFGEVAPKLLKDYSVPHLFQEDFFDVLDRDERPSFRWLITGPERSGASWHVDPALTSAWNTLLCGRKRWALYPPGKVPLGVTVHVNEYDGDVNIDTPSSLQWWLDFYPLLSNEDKPIECTQLPGETIFVPSGWWHCVLNLETTVAVTQNFVNSKNFEFVCLDMAPGYRHKGLCRAGILALDEGSFEHVKNDSSCEENHMSCSDFMRKEKRMKMHEPPESGNLTNVEFIYDIKFLSRFLDQERDHYNSEWSSSNVIGQRNMRGWLQKLWVKRPELRGLIWKGACLALNAGRWYDCLREICAFNDLPLPTDEEKLPVGMGSNPVYLVAENVIKIFVEGGLEDSLYGLGTELQFYNLLDQVNSPLKDHIPAVLGSGILFLKDGSNQVIPWDGKGVPPLIENFNMVPENHYKVDYPFGIWNRKQFEYDKVRLSSPVSGNPEGCSNVWPYIVLKRCRGKTFAELRDSLSWNDMLNLATFLGEQLHNLHTLPYPSLNGSTLLVSEQRTELRLGSGFLDGTAGKSSFSPELSTYIKTLNKKKEDISSRLTKWGDPIPITLIDKVGEYLPDDIEKLFNMFEDDKSVAKPLAKPYTWIHSDVMDDNLQMKPCNLTSCLGESTRDPSPVNNGCVNNFNDSTKSNSWRPCHIIDFSDLSLGHPICDLIPVHLDVFRGDSRLLKQFLESYKLRIVGRKSAENSRFVRASYLTMCLCILNDENVLGAIFSLWKELRQAKSWEEVEEKVWGDLNNYTGFDD